MNEHRVGKGKRVSTSKSLNGYPLVSDSIFIFIFLICGKNLGSIWVLLLVVYSTYYTELALYSPSSTSAFHSDETDKSRNVHFLTHEIKDGGQPFVLQRNIYNT